MNKEYDYLVFIGRFQPLHKAHQKVIQIGLEQSREIIVLLGSAGSSRNQRNPFTWEERRQMIFDAFDEATRKRIHILPISDQRYNENQWIANIQSAVSTVHSGWRSYGRLHPKKESYNIGLIGHAKDHSSYYLNIFPQWGSVNVRMKGYENLLPLSSTNIRHDYFGIGKISVKDIPESTCEFLLDFMTTDNYKRLVEEFKFIANHKRQWNAAPYPPTFITTDAVVVQSGHILLVERKHQPGVGLWALPGGYLNQFEKIEDGMMRELREETKMKVPEQVIRGSITKCEVFDDPYRSDRGRIITHAFLIELKATPKGLPKVKGGDDAKHAVWIPLAALEPNKLFEDHYEIIDQLIGSDLAAIRPDLRAYSKTDE